MAKIDGKKVWRVVARVDDEIIVKQSDVVEKAIRSARNAVCQRLCKSAGINYELGYGKEGNIWRKTLSTTFSRLFIF